MKSKWLLLLALPILFYSCSDNIGDNIGERNQSIVFTVKDFTDTPDDLTTRTSILDGSRFIWSEGDTVGIYPNTGGQVFFAMEEGAGASSATFDGGGWDFKPSSVYYSYYPFIGNIYLDRNHIPVSYLNQNQPTATDLEHIGAFDFMYTPGTSAADGNLHLFYSHLNCIIRVTATLPVGVYTNMTIESPDPDFTIKGYYDLEATTPSIIAIEKDNSLSISLGNIESDGSSPIVIYMMSAPVDMKGKKINVTFTDNRGIFYTQEKTPSVAYNAGAIGKLSCTSFTAINNFEESVVDLGLSVKWATFNLGASSPEEYGDYYAWAELEPYYESGYAQSENPVWKDGKGAGYDWASYRWCNGSYNSQTKYCPKGMTSHWGGVGDPDGKTTVDSEDDAAHEKWGEGWRIPTSAEFQELIDNCSSVWMTVNGINGRLFTSNKPGFTDKSIFLPATGDRYGNTTLSDLGVYGAYWSSSLYTVQPNGAMSLRFDESMVEIREYGHRFRGFSIRPVKDDRIRIKSVALNKSSLLLFANRSTQLSATISPADATDKGIIWASSNTAVATVNDDGNVTAKAVGSATISATTQDGNLTATCLVTVYPIPEAVDLGLSVKWASFNMGASSPEEYGCYYAWGETEPKDSYYWQTYKWCNKNINTLTKYNTDSSLGIVDNKTRLDLEDDAARTNLGGNWRMPTLVEIQELIDNCTIEWTVNKGVSGRRFTSKKKGYTNKSIFVPAAGYRSNIASYREGIYGSFWSSTLDPDDQNYARGLGFSQNAVGWSEYMRFYGRTIRPVWP